MYNFDGTATFAAVDGGTHTEIRVYGGLSGTITITGDMSNIAEIAVNGDVLSSGRIKVNGDMLNNGTSPSRIAILGDMLGDIEVDGDMAGEIFLDETLKETGSIIIEGLTKNSIVVDKDTEDLSLIHLKGGLSAAGFVLINDEEGAFDADGDIQVGKKDDGSTVTFDGCIRVFDDSATGNDGDLNGNITVKGCHATSDDLNICIDGAINGTISILLTGCANTVTYSCGTCP